MTEEIIEAINELRSNNEEIVYKAPIYIGSGEDFCSDKYWACRVESEMSSAKQ